MIPESVDNYNNAYVSTHHGEPRRNCCYDFSESLTGLYCYRLMHAFEKLEVGECTQEITGQCPVVTFDDGEDDPS
ncbi:unnamed protein product [Phytophthora fragariaefolia]|uniref:Unnamed protein product n=1 Tax=Phytophthora fragariaefolia TaxID=1490495 RepID=A0A9W7CWF4_9STRA|nr:unnamed protein product [Phytophthora fragariaefolia]